MKIIIRYSVRFFSFWLLFFITAHIFTIAVLTMEVISPDDAYLITRGLVLLIPLLSVLFGWLFFRNVEMKHLASVIELSITWGVLYSVTSAVTGPILYGIPWYVEYTSVASAVMDVLVLVGFFAIGYRAQKKTTNVEVNLLDPKSIMRSEKTDTLSKRSPGA